MKYFLLVTLIAIAAIAAASIPEDERVNGENGWYVPQADGSFEWVDIDEYEAYLEAVIMMELGLSLNPVNFYLFTKSNPNTGQEITATKQSIGASYFNASNPTKITIHGWTSSKNGVINTGVRAAWLSLGDCNMITIDWKRALSVDYASSVSAVPGVGKQIANFIDFLVENFKMKLEQLTIIGHSLGAHVAGFTGKNMASGKPQTIVGLDPALPLYNYDKPDERLCSTDGNYVESITTCGGRLGFLKPIGDGSFYLNGGKSQPSCGFDPTGFCAHLLAVSYYIEAVERNDFRAYNCSNYEAAVSNQCGSSYSSVRMGAITNAFSAAGVYYVPVNSEYPYGV